MRYDIDPHHTRVMFLVNHGGFSHMIGEFHRFEVFFTFDRENPGQSSVVAVVDPTSINVGHSGLNKRLQDDNFFESSKYKMVKFVSREVKNIEGNKAVLIGDLTLRGITKPLELDVTFNREGDFFGRTRAGFSIHGIIKRSDYNMESGIPDIANEVEIVVEAEAFRRDDSDNAVVNELDLDQQRKDHEEIY